MANSAAGQGQVHINDDRGRRTVATAINIFFFIPQTDSVAYPQSQDDVYLPETNPCKAQSITFVLKV
jgi:hypothetical protein